MQGGGPFCETPPPGQQIFQIKLESKVFLTQV
jgi:hypothetical protein